MGKVRVQREFGRNLRYMDGGDDYQDVVVTSSIPVTSGMDDQFALRVSNSSPEPIVVAIMSGHYDTSAFIFDEAAGTVRKTMSNPKELITAGYNVQAVADDGKYIVRPEAAGVPELSVSFTPTDPTKTIRSFTEFSKTNPRSLRNMRINVSDKAAFNTVMTVSASSPFSRPASKDIFLSRFFKANQYQPDIMEIDFTKHRLEIGDITMVFVSIPPGTAEAPTWMEFNLQF